MKIIRHSIFEIVVKKRLFYYRFSVNNPLYPDRVSVSLRLNSKPKLKPLTSKTKKILREAREVIHKK